MGFFGGLIKTSVNVVTLPLDVSYDIINMGETNKAERKIEKIEDDIEDIIK